MTNQKIYDIALQQSAWDLNCQPKDFLQKENVIVHSSKNERARKYLELPFSCNLVSYGSNIVASVSEDLEETVQNYIRKYSVEHCFETPNLDILNEALRKKDLQICFMAEYFLPDMSLLEKVPFYCAAWSNIKSVRNAIKSGFRPAWVEMTAKSTAFVAKMNR